MGMVGLLILPVLNQNDVQFLLSFYLRESPAGNKVTQHYRPTKTMFYSLLLKGGRTTQDLSAGSHRMAELL